MPEVPYREYNAITPSLIPQPSQNISAGPDAFGAAQGQALQGLGDAVARAGAVIGDTIQRRQSKIAENTATDASTSFMEKASALSTDYSQKTGKDAYDALPGYRKQIDDLWTQSVGSLQSPEAKQLFTRGTRQAYIAHTATAADHADTQFKAWSQDAAQGRADALGNQATAAMNQPMLMDTYLEGGAGEVRKKSDAAGEPPEMTESTVRNWYGKQMENIIGLKSADDPQGAMAMLQQYGPKMDPDSRARVAQKLRPLARETEADGIANTAMGVQNPTGPRGSQAQGPQGFSNNIGNLRASPANWIGKGSPYNGYETFDTPEQGAAAATKNIQHIAAAHGGSVSLADLITTWAPAGDNNDPETYAATVAKAVGMDVDDDVPIDNPDKMTAIVKAMAKVEKGSGATISDGAISTGVHSAIDGTPLPNGEPQPTATGSPDFGGLPDKSTAIQAAIKMSGNDPDLLAATVSKINQRYALHDAVTATARTQLSQQLPDVMRAAEQGDTTVTLPTDLMKQGMEAPDYEKTVTEFNTAKKIGTMTQGLAFSSDDDMKSALSDAETLSGPLGEAINAAAGGPVGSGDQAMRLALQQGAVTQIKRMQTDRAQMLTGDNADAARYVASAPNVQAAMQQWQRADTQASRENDPDLSTSGAQQYAAAVLGQQQAMGVPADKQRILTRDQATRLAQSFNPKQGQSGEEAVKAIRGGAKSWGTAWPQIATEMGSNLNPVARTIAIMPESQNLAAAHLAEAASSQKDLEDATKGTISGTTITNEVSAAFGPFLTTFRGGGVGGMQAGMQMMKSGELLTRYHVRMEGMDPAAAAKQAYTEIVGSQYDVTNGVRTPKPFDGDMVQRGSEAVVRSLGVQQTYTPQQNFDRNKNYVKPGAANFQTALTPDGEQAFRKWVTSNKVPFDPDQKGPQDYDMRGFYAALQSGDPDAKSATDRNDGKLHYPDKWKTPYHETFSAESQWATPDAPKWNDKDQLVAKDGRVLFDDRQEKIDPVLDDLGAGASSQGQYLASLKRYHSWTNSPDGKGVVLLDQHGRPVLMGDKPVFRSWQQLVALGVEQPKDKNLPQGPLGGNYLNLTGGNTATSGLGQ